MKRTIVTIVIMLILLVPLTLFAREVKPHYTLTLGGRGGYSMLTGEQKDVLKNGINVNIFMNYNPHLINNFFIQPELMYSRFGFQTAQQKVLSYYSVGVNASYNVPLLKFLELNVLGGGGYYFNRIVEENILQARSSNPYYKAGAGVDVVLTYNFNLNAGVSYINYLSAEANTPTMTIHGCGNYRFGKNPDEVGYDRSIEIGDVQIQPLFSALYKFYETSPAGKVRVTNVTKNKTVRNIKASVTVKDYMDYPTTSKAVPEIKPGESVEIDLFMLFNKNVLTVTEDTPLSAKVSVNYLVAERDYTKEESLTFKLYNRNAMTWSDDRKLSSFITPKDTPVKVFARSVVQQYKNESINVLNQNLQSAAQIFDALGSYELAYVPDPRTPFTELSQSANAIDYIQYPRETLRFKSGDCDDMTALYCALLENVGISTALVTIPGHIFMMFDTGVSRYDYREISEDRGMFVEKGETIWLPVEVTLAGKTFLAAWQEGAKQYNKTMTQNQPIGIYPTAEAWQLFVPVTLEEFGWEPEVPSKSSIATLYDKDIENLVGRELTDSVAKIEEEIRKSPKDHKLYNKLGVTYARYGKYDTAVRQLQKAVELKDDYYAAYNNIGNVHYLQGEYEKALASYKKASRYSDSPLILINMAKAIFKLGEYDEAKSYYLSAVKRDDRYEKKYAYLAMGTGEGDLRASDRTKIDTAVEWSYE